MPSIPRLDWPTSPTTNTPVISPSRLKIVDALIVPTLSIYEVFKRVLQQRGESDALTATALMQQGQTAELDSSTALVAARISHDHKLAMANSIMLATARSHRAVFWTQDRDFEGMCGVRFRQK